MKILRVDSLELAVRYARQCQAEGEFDLFRGQVQHWPLVPTLLRLDPSEQQVALTRMERFWSWIDGTPDVAAMLPSAASRIAVAQHYGLPTHLLDVSREPIVAGFFASHSEPPLTGDVESCIYCLHSDRSREAVETLQRRALADGFPEDQVELPSLIEIDVANLWRLQAQHGAFIAAPEWLGRQPEDRLLEHLLEVTCLVFPYTGPLAGVPDRWIYPDRRSALEVRLDEFFEQEALAEHYTRLRAAGFTVLDANKAQDLAGGMDFAALGFRKEVVDLLDLQERGDDAAVFIGGVAPPPHESWTQPELVDPWRRCMDERFHTTYTDQERSIVAGAATDVNELEASCVAQVSELLSSGELLRGQAVRWRILDEAGGEIPAPKADDEFPDLERTTAGRWIELAWDGLRALPYGDEELSVALGRIAAALTWIAREGSPPMPEDVLHVELVMSMGADPVATVPEAAFCWALRHDLAFLLEERWRYLAGNPGHLLLVVGRPPLLFDFERWRKLFVAYLVPSQVVANAQGGSSLAIYNPILPEGLRSH